MLGKLLKYEFKATGRVLLPIYAVMIAFALISALMFKTSLDVATGIILLIFIGICVASIILTIILTIQRFQKNLLTDEGYLMFTLPLTSTSLIFSKLIVAVVWGLVGTLIGILCGIIFALLNLTPGAITLFFQELGELMQHIDAGMVFQSLAVILSTILNYALFVLTIYLALSFGQLPIAGKHRNAMSLLAFFGIYIITSICTSILGSIFNGIALDISFSAIILIGIAFQLVIGAILFLASKWILNNHLNLE